MDFLKQVYNGLNDWWHYFLGITLVLIGYAVIGQLPLLAVIGLGVRDGSIVPNDLYQFEKTNNFAHLHVSNNTGFLVMLCLFIFAALGLYLAVKLHGKKPLDIITIRRPFDWNRFFYGAAIWMGFTIFAELILYLFDQQNYVMTINWAAFIPLLVISFVLLPIQTATEEIFFRGYLNQGMFLLFKSPIISIVLSTVLFSMVHSMNPEIEKFGFFTMQVYYISAGLFLALLCFLDNGLELSIGIHTATNIFGATCVTYEGAVLQTDTLFKIKETNPWLMTFSFLLAAALFLMIAGKKYGWNIGESIKTLLLK
jgi:uncharacterized protein